MALSEYQLYNMSFSYLNGSDLSLWTSPALLISRYQVNPANLQNGCNQAYAQVNGKLSTKYNILLEYQKTAFTNAQAMAAVTTGGVTGITLTSPGSNYATVPDVSLGGPGTGASADAVITDTVVSGFENIVPGTGYITAPSVLLTGGAAADTRSALLVQISSLFAIRCILGGLANISPDLAANFKWADEQVFDIRNAQGNLPLELPANQTDANGCIVNVYSKAELIASSFRVLG